MRYFHRTSIDPGRVLEEADAFFGQRLAPSEQGERSRAFGGSLGQMNILVRPEGGHYTHITATTDRPGESELDKLVKRFLGTIHSKADSGHQLRGAY